MKMTWREQADGAWVARHYPSSQKYRTASKPFDIYVVPFQLTVSELNDDAIFPWHWKVERHGVLLGNGSATDIEAARNAAHGDLIRHL